MTVNKVILIGNLGADPEIRFTNSGLAVTKFSIATSERWGNKEGGREERTEWHRVVAFGKLAETCGKWLSKGRQVFVEGRIQTREWEDRDGIKRWSTDIVANDVRFLGRAGDKEQSAADAPSNSQDSPHPQEDSSSPPDDDIPF
jgi:single-strand DNA-binding protein